MTNNPDDHLSKATTFRFASGQSLTLNQNQIDKIPYVSALVSSADWFESARDEDGYLKLDPCIVSEDFIYILKSLSFRSIRQLFTYLPKQTSVISIVYLVDFLGLGSQPGPTLEEVDLAFFSTVSYNPLTEKHSRIIKLCVIQDMAVRFGIAIVKEEYDFSKDEVIDHVYWLIMFILSAWKLFGPRVRYHVYAIAKNCFTVFKPSQLEPLLKLKRRMDYDTRKRTSMASEYDDGRDVEYFLQLEDVLDFSCDLDEDEGIFQWYLEGQLDWRFSFASSNYISTADWLYSRENVPTEEKLLKPASERVLQIIYERLQYQICRRAAALLSDNQTKKTFMVDRETHSVETFLTSKLEVLPQSIGSLLESELIEQEIRELALQELSILTPKLKQEHVTLQRNLQLYESHQNIENENNLYFSLWYSFDPITYELLQKKTLCYTLLINKLDHSSDITVTQIEQHVSKSLHDAALKQFNQWLNTQHKIDALRHSLTPNVDFDHLFSKRSKNAYQRYRTPAPKPVPKRQLKYSKY